MHRFVPAFVLALLSIRPALAETSPNPVSVHLVKSASAQGARLVAATVAPVQRATVSTRMAATVQKILVSEGKHVKHGQLLLELSADDVRAQLASATTALTNAQAYERRIAALVSSHAATAVELENAQAQRAQAEAAVAATRSSLGYTQLRAPFDGVVQARRVNVGDFVGPGQPLIDVEGAALELQATLSEGEAAELRIGARLTFESNGQTGQAELTALTPGGDALSHRRTLRAQVRGTVANLRSGAFVRLVIPGGARAPEARVPQSALVQRGDLAGVFIAENGRAHLRWLSLGEVSGTDVLVRAGLQGNEAIIDAPGSLYDDQPVAISSGAQQ
jgi:membrane fusion protein (multidrug efflux system)